MRTSEYVKYGPPEIVRIVEREPPVPKENELLIKIHAATVSAVDSIFRSGRSFPARVATGVIKPRQKTLGNDFAGIVEAVGSRVTRFQPGDRIFGENVMGFGSHAEYMTVPENAAMEELPENINFEQAAAIPYGALTALPFLRDTAKLTSGQKIMIIGATGAVGLSALQLARNFGAEVTAVCSAGGAQLVRSLGANHVLDYNSSAYTAHDKSYDVIFDAVGKSSFSKCKKWLGPQGVYMVTVITMGIIGQILLLNPFRSRKARLSFTGLRPVADKEKDLKFIRELVATGKLRPVIDKSYPLDQIIEAHRYVDSGHKQGSVVVSMIASPLRG